MIAEQGLVGEIDRVRRRERPVGRDQVAVRAQDEDPLKLGQAVAHPLETGMKLRFPPEQRFVALVVEEIEDAVEEGNIGFQDLERMFFADTRCAADSHLCLFDDLTAEIGGRAQEEHGRQDGGGPHHRPQQGQRVARMRGAAMTVGVDASSAEGGRCVRRQSLVPSVRVI